MAKQDYKAELDFVKTCISNALKDFHSELHGIIENEFKNAQKLADFIIKTSERQERLLTQLETLTQTIQELLKAINKKGEKPTYAT